MKRHRTRTAREHEHGHKRAFSMDTIFFQSNLRWWFQCLFFCTCRWVPIIQKQFIYGESRPCTFCTDVSARFAGTESCPGAHSASENAFDRSLRARLFVSARRDNLHEQSSMQLMLSLLWAFVYVCCVHAHAVYIRWFFFFFNGGEEH